MAGGGEKRVSQKKTERKTEQDGNKELFGRIEKEISLPANAAGVASDVAEGEGEVANANASEVSTRQARIQHRASGAVALGHQGLGPGGGHQPDGFTALPAFINKGPKVIHISLMKGL